MPVAFYITTPLYYVNDTPHIGHAYTTTVADVLARYHRLFGEEVVFLTGTDEHGQKVQAAAQKRNMPPQAHCDEMVQNFQNIWQELGINYDIFYRTTDANHKTVVRAALQKLFDKDEIYEQDYEGWYAVSEEIFYTEKDLVDGKSPAGNEVQKVSEKNYFFRMSKYQDQLLQYIKDNPNCIEPQSRKNEVLGFLQKPLQDLCISRPKSRMAWGIELPFDDNFVTYVWFDALLNYAAAVGFLQDGRQEEFAKCWQRPNGALHLIGKDILTTHCVYWTTMLMALEVDLPKKVFAHGWWLTAGNEKMSKSKGEVVKPLDMKEKVGIEPLRYFLVRDISLGNDAQFSPDLVVSRVNAELANTLGNLLSRSTNLVDKYFDAKLPALGAIAQDEQELLDASKTLMLKVKADIEALKPSQALEHVVALLRQANVYIGEREPWRSAKTELAAAGTCLRVVLEVLRSAGIALHPVMPKHMEDLLSRLSVEMPKVLPKDMSLPALVDAQAISKAAPLFPRF